MADATSNVSAFITTFLLFGCIITFFWLGRLLITNANNYTFTDDLECHKLDQFIETSKPFVITENIISLWNYKIDINDLEKRDSGAILMSCPSSYSRDAQLVLNDQLLAKTKVDNFYNDFYVNDCHDISMLFIENTFKQNPAFKDLYIIKQIWSYDKANLYGYVVKQQLFEEGFRIIDENKKTLVKVVKNHFSLSWDIEIIDPKHPAANANLVLLLIGKIAFNTAGSKKRSNDLCNETYNVINFFYYFMIIIAPFVCIYFIFLILKPEWFEENNNESGNSNTLPSHHHSGSTTTNANRLVQDSTPNLTVSASG